jgi:hypothetical protein
VNTRFLVVLGLILVLLALFKKTGTTAAQGISGAIQGISIDGVRMGAHLTPKSPGQQTDISVNWMGATKNAAGAGITWFYRVNVDVIHAGTGQILLSATGPSTVGEFGVGKNTTHRVNLPTTLTPGAFLSVVAHLQALTSDPNGLPTSTWGRLADVEHTNAIQVVGAALPGGSITGAVNVSQQHASRDQQVRAMFHGALRGR